MTNVAGDRSALCRLYLPYADSLARDVHTYVGAALPLRELRSAARVGLFGAARRFDPSRCVRFELFAKPRILGAIVDELRHEHVTERRAAGRPLELKALLSGRATASEISELVEESSLAWLGAWRAISGIRAVPDGDATSLVAVVDDDVEGADEAIERAERLAAVAAALAGLDARKRALVESVFAEGHALEVAAAAVGCTKSWACRLLAEAIGEVRRALLRANHHDLFVGRGGRL